MIHHIERYFRHSDPRGSIEGLIQWGTWKEINLIRSEKNCVRGNHYHQNTIELFIILEGIIEVSTQGISNGTIINPPDVEQVSTGDVFIIKPNIIHTFFTQTAAIWINALSEPITSISPDIHYLPYKS